MPPTIFGYVRRSRSTVPDDTRSGLNASEKSVVGASPDASRIRAPTRCRVVPTGTVVSTMISTPRFRCGAIAATAESSSAKSGRCAASMSTGTINTTTSASATASRASVVARSAPLTTSAGDRLVKPRLRRQRIALRVDLADARGADVVAGNRRALRRELHRQRHADLAQPDDRDIHGVESPVTRSPAAAGSRSRRWKPPARAPPPRPSPPGRRPP